MTQRVTEQLPRRHPDTIIEDKGRGGEPEIKVIDFLVSGSESIELLSRSLPSLVDGVFI